MITEKKGKLDLAEGDDFNLSSLRKLLKFTRLHNVSDNKYEKINIRSEDGDSIYYPPLEELKGGQVYVSHDKIGDIVTRIIDQRLGPAINNNSRNDT